MKVVRTFVAVAIAGLISIGSVAAQQSTPPAGEQERAKTPEPVTGELVSIAADTKTLVVKTGADKEMTFTYSDQTEIMGADKGAAGLATAKGSMVTVHYTVRGTTNVAAKIEVIRRSRLQSARRASQDRPVQLCVPASTVARRIAIAQAAGSQASREGRRAATNRARSSRRTTRRDRRRSRVPVPIPAPLRRRERPASTPFRAATDRARARHRPRS